ncbi:MFS transporter [Chloroflexota bacterium]
MHWKPPKVFYGWWVVSAAFLIALYMGGVVFYGFTAIFEPIADEMGWSYTQISLAASLRGLEAGLLAPLIGVLTDRWGPRRIVFGGAVFGAAGLILLGHTMSIGMFYGAFVLLAVGMSACTMTALMTAVTNWFRRNVGLVSGIAVSGFGFAGLLVPVIVTFIELYDWRTTVIILALGMSVTVLPLSLLLRHRPEQYGYLPDGEAEVSIAFNNGTGQPQAVEVDIKAKQALKSSVFWRIAVAFTFHAILVGAIVTHVMPYLSSIGIARSRSSLVATAIPLTSIGGRLGLGWLGDKTNRTWVVVGGFIMMGLGILCFGYVANVGSWLLVPFLILFSTGYGGCNALRPSLIRDYFTRTNFGTIFGLIIGINSLGGMVGPPLAGWVYDNWGSYQGIWLVFAGLAVVAVISTLTTSPVRNAVQLADRN